MGKENSAAKGRTITERVSDRELVVTRTFNGPAHLVFEAWSTPDLFKQWWVPASFGLELLSCEMDVRVGGAYRLVFKHPAGDQPMAFFGRYLEVAPNARMVWTNEENGQEGPVTTVTFEEEDGRTFATVRDLYPSKQALDDAIASGSTGGFPEQFDQLDLLLAA